MYSMVEPQHLPVFPHTAGGLGFEVLLFRTVMLIKTLAKNSLLAKYSISFLDTIPMTIFQLLNKLSTGITVNLEYVFLLVFAQKGIDIGA